MVARRVAPVVSIVHPRACAIDAANAVPEQHGPATLLDHARIRLGHAREVDHPALRHVERPDALHVRLELAELVELDLPQREAVRPPPLDQRLVARELLAPRRDDELAAEPVRDRVLVGEGDQRLPALAAEAGLERSRNVVQARVQHTRVVPALVGRDAVLLLDHGHARVRPPLEQAHRGREPDEAGADDGEVELVGHRPPARGGPIVLRSTPMPSISSSTTSPARSQRPSLCLGDAAAADRAGADHVAGPQQRVERGAIDDRLPRVVRSRRFPRERSSPFTRATISACEPSNSSTVTSSGPRLVAKSLPFAGPSPTRTSCICRSRADQSFMHGEPSDTAARSDDGGNLELVVELLGLVRIGDRVLGAEDRRRIGEVEDGDLVPLGRHRRAAIRTRRRDVLLEREEVANRGRRRNRRTQTHVLERELAVGRNLATRRENCGKALGGEADHARALDTSGPRNGTTLGEGAQPHGALTCAVKPYRTSPPHCGACAGAPS